MVCGETERLFLLSGVRHRVFPNALVQTCRDREAAGRDGAVAALRRSRGRASPRGTRFSSCANATPVIAVAERHDLEDPLAAGAQCFLEQAKWLMIGKTIAEQGGTEAS